MIEAWKTLNSFYTNWLHPTFDSLISFLAGNQYAIYALIAVVIALSIVRTKVKIPKLLPWIDFVAGMIVLLLLVVIYSIFSPAISKFFKSTPSTTPINSTTTPATTTPGTSTQSSTQTQKQLYYSVGCSSCWNEACQKNGYSYGGYDATSYNYYVTLCKSCSCNSYRAQSLWR